MSLKHRQLHELSRAELERIATGYGGVIEAVSEDDDPEQVPCFRIETGSPASSDAAPSAVIEALAGGSRQRTPAAQVQVSPP
jgi:hypothetical protein